MKQVKIYTDSERETKLTELYAEFSALQSQYTKLDNVSMYTDELAKSFPLGRVGGSGRNNYNLNKKRDRDLDKTIDNAKKSVELSKHINEVEDEIVYLEYKKDILLANKQKSTNELLAEYFKNIKVGDTYTPGNTPCVIVKVSKKSIVTEGGCKWTAAEVIGTNAAKLL